MQSKVGDKSISSRWIIAQFNVVIEEFASITKWHLNMALIDEPKNVYSAPLVILPLPLRTILMFSIPIFTIIMAIRNYATSDATV